MTEPVPDFELSAVLNAHEGAVRAVSAAHNGWLFTGAQDRMVYAWESVGGVWEQRFAVPDHGHWVTALAALPPGTLAECPDGGVVTGCLDKHIRIYGTDGKLVRTLSGHTGGVTSLAWTAEGKLLSGSWDGTAREWDVETGACGVTRPGHENGVCVLGLPGGTVVTGSTGRQEGNGITGFQVRVYRGAALQGAHKEHSAAVRALAATPQGGFLSCSNDGSVCARDASGAVLTRMAAGASGATAEPPFLFTVAALPSGEVLAGGDDGCVRVWRGGAEVQRLQLPNTVWALAALPNGDVAVACADNRVYVLTREEARRGAPALAADVRDRIAATAAGGGSGGGGMDVSGLSKWEDRAGVAGKSNGEIRVFNRGGKGWVASWDEDAGAWTEVGEMVGGPGDSGPGRKTELDGQMWDLIVPVEAETGEGLRTVKLGYNFGTDPFEAASAFAVRHSLPEVYVEQIANHLVQQTPAHLRPTASSGMPGSAPAPAPAAAEPTMIPPRVYEPLRGGKARAIVGKLLEFNDAMAEEQSSAALAAADVSRLQDLREVLAETARYHASTLPAGTPRLASLLCAWPDTRVFPVLDLFRLAFTHSDADTLSRDDAVSALVRRALEAVRADVAWPAVMCGLRLLQNAFYTSTGRAAVRQLLPDVVQAAAQHATPEQREKVMWGVVGVLQNAARMCIVDTDLPAPARDEAASCIRDAATRVAFDCGVQHEGIVSTAVIAYGTAVKSSARVKASITMGEIQRITGLVSKSAQLADELKSAVQ